MAEHKTVQGFTREQYKLHNFEKPGIEGTVKESTIWRVLWILIVVGCIFKNTAKYAIPAH
jgi:hypothetical protein